MYDVRIGRINELATDIYAMTLEPCDGRDAPEITPGMHVNLRMPSGIERSYSLVNAPKMRKHLEIAVKLEADGRGGSRELCSLPTGTQLTVVEQTNDFALDENDETHVLIAAGIGITPLWSMIQYAESADRAWVLHYCAKSRSTAAYLDELEKLEAQRTGRVHLYFSDEDKRLDMAAVVAGLGPSDGAYCCGPERITAAFSGYADGLGDRAHVEDFSVAEVAAGGFVVMLARSEIEIQVPEDSTILDAVLAAGVDPDYSCMSGTCGSCEVAVLEGEPDHQDFVLTDEEKEVGDRMMICCSGCRGNRLVIDL